MKLYLWSSLVLFVLGACVAEPLQHEITIEAPDEPAPRWDEPTGGPGDAWSPQDASAEEEPAEGSSAWPDADPALDAQTPPPDVTLHFGEVGLDFPARDAAPDTPEKFDASTDAAAEDAAAEDAALPPASDLDDDGVPDTADLCPNVADPLQLDADQDHVGDACDVEPLLFNPCQQPLPKLSFWDRCEALGCLAAGDPAETPQLLLEPPLCLEGLKLARPPKAPDWSFLARCEAAGCLELRRISLLGNAEANLGARKQHGLFLAGESAEARLTARLEDCSIHDNPHAGIYIYQHVDAWLHNCRGSGNGMGDLVFTGGDSVVYVEDCNVEHLNHEREGSSPLPMILQVNRCQTQHTGILNLIPGDDVTLVDVSASHSVTLLNVAGGRIAALRPQWGCKDWIDIYFPHDAIVFDGYFDAPVFSVVFQTRWRPESSGSVTFVDSTFRVPLRTVGEGVIRLEGCTFDTPGGDWILPVASPVTPARLQVYVDGVLYLVEGSTPWSPPKPLPDAKPHDKGASGGAAPRSTAPRLAAIAGGSPYFFLTRQLNAHSAKPEPGPRSRGFLGSYPQGLWITSCAAQLSPQVAPASPL